MSHELPGERGPTPLPESLAAPARRALAASGIENLEGVSSLTKSELKNLHGIGPMAVLQLDRALRTNGLGFKA